MTVTDERLVSWRDRALCLKEDPELFWDDERDSQLARRKKITAAKRVCMECPVWQECREYGMRVAVEDRWSILGGLTYPERRALRRMEMN